MESLVKELKENLIQRRKNEMDQLHKLKKETDKELVLILSGKIFELDFIIKCMDELISYNERLKEIAR